MKQKIKKKSSSLNFALIGCGRIAQTHLQAISEVSDANLIAVVDVNEEAAKAASERFGCEAYKDYKLLQKKNRVDAVVISSPPNTHFEIATFFLKNHVHVLCEKPFALNSEQAELMVKAAKEHDCRIMMASKFRYVEDVILAKSIVASGILGEIILFENVFCSKVDMQDRWNSKKEIAGGGVLFDNGSHSIDIVRFLIGPITKVQAGEGKRVQKFDVEDTAHLYFKTKSNTQGVIDLSWSIHKERESYVDIFGTEGVLSIGWKCSKYRQSEKLNWVTFGSGYDKSSAFRRQLNNFIATIKGVEPPLITEIDALESVRVIEAAYQSISEDKWVNVNGSKKIPIKNSATSMSIMSER